MIHIHALCGHNGDKPGTYIVFEFDENIINNVITMLNIRLQPVVKP